MDENERIVCEFLRKIAPSREWRYLGEVEHYWIGELCDELNEQLKAENAKLRDALKVLMMGTNVELCAHRGEPDCKRCSMHHGKDGCTVVDAMELLGIDMYGEPLRIEMKQ